MKNSTENSEMIGGDEIVEIDKNHIISRRDSRGRITSRERFWLIAAIGRFANKML